MRTLKFIQFCLAAAVVFALFSCKEEARNTVPLEDPWLKERTPVAIRLEAQIGKATIVNDWRNDEEGSITLPLVSARVNLAAVKINQLTLPQGATATISEGDTFNFTGVDNPRFTITSENGLIRIYTVRFVEYADAISGTYSMDATIPWILDNWGTDFRASYGGSTGAGIVCTLMDKSWQWGDPDEDKDNILSFKLTDVDEITGDSGGTVVHHPGPDGLFSAYLYQGALVSGSNPDRSSYYRLFPKGTSRWEKRVERIGDDDVTRVYLYDYVTEAPLWVLNVVPRGTYDYFESNNSLTIPEMAFQRTWPPPYTESDTGSDDRFIFYNLREIFWTVHKESGDPHPDHDAWLGVNY